jgi:hypothetical protein
MKALAILVAGFLLSGFPARRADAQEHVEWTNESNTRARGSALAKIGGCDGCDDAAAMSRQMIRSGDGYVEFTVDDPGVFWVAGLSSGDAEPRFRNIDYGFRFNGDGRADVIENGAYRAGSDTTYASGDVFRVAVVRGRVQYIKNGRILTQSLTRPNYPLVLAAALGSRGEAIQNARIDGADRFAAGLGGSQQRFYDLDINGDGVVSLSEWRGRRQEFNRLDVNRDRVLTSRELPGYGIDPFDNGRYGGVGTGGEIVRVDAAQEWNDTGIYVRAGDTLRFDADGLVRLTPGPTSDTATPAGSTTGRRAPGAAMSQEGMAGALIARIDNSGPIFIGNSRTIRAPRNGRLFLGVNDDHWLDNSGDYRVVVTVDPR